MEENIHWQIHFLCVFFKCVFFSVKCRAARLCSESESSLRQVLQDPLHFFTQWSEGVSQVLEASAGAADVSHIAMSLLNIEVKTNRFFFICRFFSFLEIVSFQGRTCQAQFICIALNHTYKGASQATFKTLPPSKTKESSLNSCALPHVTAKDLFVVHAVLNI